MSITRMKTRQFRWYAVAHTMTVSPVSRRLIRLLKVMRQRTIPSRVVASDNVSKVLLPHPPRWFHLLTLPLAPFELCFIQFQRTTSFIPTENERLYFYCRELVTKKKRPSVYNTRS